MKLAVFVVMFVAVTSALPAVEEFKSSLNWPLLEVLDGPKLQEHQTITVLPVQRPAYTDLKYSATSVISPQASVKGLEVILDGDPGADDSMAWMLMGSRQSPADVLAVTTVRGNTGVVNATRNALLVLQTINRQDIPVYSGSKTGLVFSDKPDNYYGHDGLGDMFHNKPSYDCRSHGHAAIAMADIVKNKPGKITILLTGPMTNLALALHYYPDIIKDAKDIIFLGGSYKGPGVIRPGVEFNVKSDPEAVALVLEHVPKGKPITFVPTDIINDIAIPVDWRKNVLGELNTCLTDFMNKAELVSLTKDKVWTPCDQLAATVVMEPSVVLETALACVAVETCGENNRGEILVDSNCTDYNVRFVTAVDKQLFMENMIRYMNSTEECS